MPDESRSSPRVIVQLYDMYQQSNQLTGDQLLINLFKLKIRAHPEKKFSMNFKEKEQVSISTSISHVEFKISYRFNCLFIGFGLDLVILDRKSKKIMKKMILARELACATIDDDSNSVYMITGSLYVGFFVEKYELSSFLTKGTKPVCIWSEKQEELTNPYAMIVLNRSGMLIVCECTFNKKLSAISCEMGKSVEIESLPRVDHCSSIQKVSENEFIAVYFLNENTRGALIEMFRFDEGKFHSVLMAKFPIDLSYFRGHSQVYDSISQHIYITDYSQEGTVYVFRKSDLEKVGIFEGVAGGGFIGGICLDKYSGELLVYKDGVIHVLE